MELTYCEIENILDMKYIDVSSTGYILQKRICEFSDNKLMLKSSLPDEVKVFITIEDIRLKSTLTTKKTYRLTEKSFRYSFRIYSKSLRTPR